jgi:uncharacterized protein
MSKPDAASGSLENILASIRKSLAEQSADAGSEVEVAAPAIPPAKDPAVRKGGLTQRLAGAGSEAPTAGEGQSGDDLADMLEEQIANPPPAPPAPAAGKPTAGAAAAPEAKLPEEDPLWFLTRRDEPAPAEAAATSSDAGRGTANGNADAKSQAGEPILTRPEVVRATMPPFFGSTAEVAKHEAQGTGVEAAAPPRPPEVAPSVLTPPVSAFGMGTGHQARPVAAGADTPTAPRSQPSGGTSLNNGWAGRTAEAPGDARAVPAGDLPHTRALEAAVLDLLRPMLSQWLERNMPRLVAEALKEEAARARASESKKV